MADREDVGAKAEQVIKKLVQTVPGKNYTKIELTTGQIRKFLTAVNSLTNKIEVYKSQNENIETLPEDLVMEIKYLKVKIAYQAGRDKSRNNTVKNFVNDAELFKRIDKIGNSLKAYEEFARYIEALVAYHKFYGGKD
jgi:CRISPR-associated protein Csm2